MDNMRNKIVMVTGGAAGLGYKYAEILLQNGAKIVAIIDLPTSDGKIAASTLENQFGKGRAVFVACDIAKAKKLKKTFARVIDAFGTLDILVNNAGIMNETLHKWERTIDINVIALIRSSYLALDHMGKHEGGKGGLIVNISSIAGLTYYPSKPVYTASKHAVIGFSHSLAGLYEKTGVRVLVMCPVFTALTTSLSSSKRIYFISNEYVEGKKYYFFRSGVLKKSQSVDHVASAMLELIQKGKNGAVWVSEEEKAPYAVDFPHYSALSLPV